MTNFKIKAQQKLETSGSTLFTTFYVKATSLNKATKIAETFKASVGQIIEVKATDLKIVGRGQIFAGRKTYII